MNTQLKDRLDVLRREHANGMEALADLQRREQDLRTTLLRISGAIQVLEELLGESAGAPSEAP